MRITQNLFQPHRHRTRSSTNRIVERLEHRELLASHTVPGQLLQLGDFNGDRLLDVADIDLLSAHLIDSGDNLKFDANLDGVVNLEDHAYWVQTLHRTSYGDANLNGEFGTDDLIRVFQAGRYESGNVGTSWSEGDFNGDGVFDTGDLIFAFQDLFFETGLRPLTEPTISLAEGSDSAPLGDAATVFRTVQLVGSANPLTTIEFLPSGVTAVADASGNYSVDGVPLRLGRNEIAAVVSDVNGATATTHIAIQRTPMPGFSLLTEGNLLVSETLVDVELSAATGARTISFRLDVGFDESDRTSQLHDTLLVYLVDTVDTGITLLDRGEPGTSLFTLAEDRFEAAPGVRFDGDFVEFDVTNLDVTRGRLLFQLLSADNDDGTQIAVGDFQNVVEIDGKSMPQRGTSGNLKGPGESLEFTGLTATSDVSLEFQNVRFQSDSGMFVSELSLANNGTAKGRQMVVTFPDLPPGVQLSNRSGVNAQGHPYINFLPAIVDGGLGRGEVSDPIRLELQNPAQIRMNLTAQVFVGPPNRAPIIQSIATQTVMPGDEIVIPLAADDPDGDPVTFSIQRGNSLPTGYLAANNELRFSPLAGQQGSYLVEVIASDGALTSRRQFNLNVVADPVSSTRVSGVVQTSLLEPLAGVPVSVGNVETITAADGSFLLDFGDNALPSDTILIRADELTGPQTYPFLAEKLGEVFGHEVNAGVNNIISRPIYLPALDMENAVTVDPSRDMTITNPELPGVSLFVAAGTARNEDGSPFTGQISITRVPVDRAPLAMPEFFSPDMLLTVQPAGLVFSTPAPITLPNTAGWTPGTVMDFFQVSPESGAFEDFGDMVVSEDGSVIETVSGGVQFSSWHGGTPPPESGEDSDDSPD